MGGWSTDRPIYHRLPAEAEAYQGNPLVDAITMPYDNLLVEWRGLAANFEADYLDPDTCQGANLDWLAQLCGFTGDYWDPTWTEAQKRQLIKNSHNFIWPNKGTQTLLEYLIQVFQIQATIYQIGGLFLAGFSAAGDSLGGGLLRYWILMGADYRREGAEWALVERLNRLYMPCFTESVVCYDGFYAGFSVAGDPVF